MILKPFHDRILRFHLENFSCYAGECLYLAPMVTESKKNASDRYWFFPATDNLRPKWTLTVAFIQFIDKSKDFRHSLVKFHRNFISYGDCA